MKLKSILIAAGYVLSLVALLLTFAAATHYAVLFGVVIILSTAAIFCTWRAACTGGAHGVLLFPFLLALYALRLDFLCESEMGLGCVKTPTHATLSRAASQFRNEDSR